MKHYSADCAYCERTHTVERDELGASLETWACSTPGCTVRMCGLCLSHCYSCGKPCCEPHLAQVDADDPKSMWCQECRELEARMMGILGVPFGVVVKEVFADVELASRMDAAITAAMAECALEDAPVVKMYLDAGLSMSEARAALLGGVN